MSEDMRAEADLLKSISNVTRLQILRTLLDGPQSFTNLMKMLNVGSSGELTFHLEKLDSLVTKNCAGEYLITNLGKSILSLTSELKNLQLPIAKNDKKVGKWMGVIAAVGGAIILLGSLLTGLGSLSIGYNTTLLAVPIVFDWISYTLNWILIIFGMILMFLGGRILKRHKEIGGRLSKNL